MSDSLTFDGDGRIGRLTFNRPQQMNAIDLAMARALGAFAKTLPQQRDLRVLILTGAGASFMAGGDVTAFKAPPDEAVRVVGEIIDNVHAFVLALQAAPATVIALVNGVAAGAGFSFALGADIVIAADNAKFAPAYLKLGATPDGGGTFFLPRLAGAKAAHEIFLEGRVLSAEDALRLRLINRIAPAADLAKAGDDLASRLAAGAGQASGAAKALLKRGLIDGLEAHLAAEKDSFLACVRTPDFQEGVAAFVEKRAAKFS